MKPPVDWTRAVGRITPSGLRWAWMNSQPLHFQTWFREAENPYREAPAWPK